MPTNTYDLNRLLKNIQSLYRVRVEAFETAEGRDHRYVVYFRDRPVTAFQCWNTVLEYIDTKTAFTF